jgi:hypothetical protein
MINLISPDCGDDDKGEIIVEIRSETKVKSKN